MMAMAVPAVMVKVSISRKLSLPASPFCARMPLQPQPPDMGSSIAFYHYQSHSPLPLAIGDNKQVNKRNTRLRMHHPILYSNIIYIISRSRGHGKEFFQVARLGNTGCSLMDKDDNMQKLYAIRTVQV